MTGGGAVGIRGAPVTPYAPFGTLPVNLREGIVLDRVTGCWVFTGPLDSHGYGQVGYQRRTWMAHRLAYTQLVGPIPDGLQLDHLCRVPRCVNPRHLEPVTLHENIRRGTQGWNHAIKTHCPQGHPYDETNTYRHRGKRQCRVCLRAANRRYYQRKKEQAA